LTASGSVGFSFEVFQSIGNTYLFLQVDSKPTFSSYAYSVTTKDASKTLTPCVGQRGIWWIGVYGYSDATYSIEGTQRSDFVMADGSTANGVLSRKCAIYYEIPIPQNVFLMQIILQQSSNSYSIFQLLSSGYLPTTGQYGYCNYTVNYNGYSCLSIKTPAVGIWYYAVETPYLDQSYKTQLQLNGDGGCNFASAESLPLKRKYF